jgi:TonB family protein
VRYDWERQIFELTPQRATELLARPVIQHTDFVVKDREGVIYRGRLYRSVANDPYDGATILVDQGPLKQLPASPFFCVTGGYPNGGGSHDRDRYSSRLHDALEKAGVLNTIAVTDLPLEQLWSGHTWIGGDQVLKASAVLFPETFRVGKDAYLHILLYKGQHPVFTFDQLVVTATCTSAAGRFVAKQELLTITPPLLDNGLYVCKFHPWEGSILPDSTVVVTPPKVKSSPLPRYPKDAANENREGAVVIAVRLDSAGKVKSVTLAQGSGSDDLDRSATRAIQKWTFTPATEKGQALEGQVRIRLTFAGRHVHQETLPLEPEKITAKPGPMDLNITITAYKREGDKLTQTGCWALPPRKITLLAATLTKE